MLEERLEKIVFQKSTELYGKELPQLVCERINKELDLITQNKWTNAYLALNDLLLPKYIHPHEYSIRGFGWNSFVAYLLGILPNINPLPAHYRCPKDKYSNFDITMNHVKFGIELPDKNCPICGERMLKDGWSLPEKMLMERPTDTNTKKQIIIQFDTGISCRKNYSIAYLANILICQCINSPFQTGKFLHS